MMLSKKDYSIHFARLFFTSLLFGICSLFSYLWNIYQPFQLAFQLQRCQSTISIIEVPQISIWNWLNNFHFINLLPSFSFLSTSISQRCHSYIKDEYSLNINKFIEFIHSILLIYFVYRLIHLSLFHSHLQHLQGKQYYYANLYRQEQKIRKYRCSNRLL